MTIRKVIRAGHPIIRRSSREVAEREEHEESLHRLIEDMLETMRDHDGVGLAAPQVQSGLRVIVYEIEPNERYPDLEESVGPRVMINPVIEARSAELHTSWEGCLSVPELRGPVPRHQSVEVTYRDRGFESNTIEVSGFEARVIQHEIDHLNGILFVERMRTMKKLSFRREYRRHQADSSS